LRFLSPPSLPPLPDLENVLLGEPPSSRLFLDACMKRILGSVDPKAASLTMDWSPLDVDVLWCVRLRCLQRCSCFALAPFVAHASCSFGALIFELAAGHIMASPAMHESHLPSWTSPHIRIMLGSIFNAHGASGAARQINELRAARVSAASLARFSVCGTLRCSHPPPPLRRPHR
jgi:hypothetical protein